MSERDGFWYCTGCGKRYDLRNPWHLYEAIENHSDTCREERKAGK